MTALIEHKHYKEFYFHHSLDDKFPVVNKKEDIEKFLINKNNKMAYVITFCPNLPATFMMTYKVNDIIEHEHINISNKRYLFKKKEYIVLEYLIADLKTFSKMGDLKQDT